MLALLGSGAQPAIAEWLQRRPARRTEGGPVLGLNREIPNPNKPRNPTSNREILSQTANSEFKRKPDNAKSFAKPKIAESNNKIPLQTAKS